MRIRNLKQCAQPPADEPFSQTACKKKALCLVISANPLDHIVKLVARKVAERDGKPVGSWGAAAAFSLHPLKNLNVWGDGGMIVTKSAELRDGFQGLSHMFKVFRRDCLYGLTFECNRFDFDWELVIKLVRKGYRPLEIPVNYNSRSIKEGKKVTLVRDPLTWLRALWRFKRSPLYFAGRPASHRAGVDKVSSV